MEYVSDHLGWFLFLSVITFIIFNLQRVEKMLMRFNIRVDLNRDGMIGTGSVRKDPWDDDTVALEAIKES